MDKDTKIIKRFLRDMQGTNKYKGKDKLSKQYKQAEKLKTQLKK